MEVLRDIGINIFAAVILSFVGWLTVRYFIPWFRNLWYQGPDLSGDWLPYDSNEPEGEPYGRTTIVQKGTHIHMTTTRTRSRSGKRISRTFSYKGTFLEGQLNLKFEEDKAKGYIQGNILLRLSSNQQLLVGKTTYYDHDLNEVVSKDVCLSRV